MQKLRQKTGKTAGWAAACVIMFVPAVLLRIISRLLPGFADRYTDIVNPFMVGTLGRLSGSLPFSVFEVLLCFLVLFCIRIIFCAAACLFVRNRREAAVRDLRKLCRVLALIASGMLLLFEISEDVYFSRTRFAQRYGLERKNYTNEELAETCEYLIGEINKTAPYVDRSENGIMQISPGLRERMCNAMHSLGEEYPELSGWYPRPKPVFFSGFLSRCDITGVYSMFTIEANYNRDIPPYNLPFTMGHELSHLKGFESEKEANFLGYLCCIRSDETDLHYSGAMLGWVYCGNELKKRDPRLWKRLAGEICPEAEEDLHDNNRYWDAWKGRVSETMHDINDTYLKAEGLEEGYASYELVTDMIVAHYYSQLEIQPDVV